MTLKCSWHIILERKIEQADADYICWHKYNCIVGPDGVTEEHVVFIKQHEDIDQNSASLESGAFFPIAYFGYTAQVSTWLALSL